MSDSPQAEVMLMAAFCEGIARPTRFAEGLRDAAKWLACSQVWLHIWDRRGRWGCLRSARRNVHHWECEASDAVLPDPMLRARVKAMEPGRWYRRESSEAAWLVRLSLPHAEALLGLHMPAAAASPGTSPPECAGSVVAAIRPSLEPLAQVLRLTHRVANLSLVLDSVRMPMVLLDASLRIQAINHAARSVFKLGPRTADGQIRATLSNLPGDRLDALVNKACGLSGPPEGSMIRLAESAESAARGGVCHVLVMPAPHGAQTRQSALVLVCDDVQRQGVDDAPAIALLQHSYGLTPAETRLARLILEGQSPGHVAQRLQVSVATVRSQLSSVLRKTGASRQSDLVRRLSPLLMLSHSVRVH